MDIWNRTACPEKIVTVQERCGKNIEFLRFNGIFSREEPGGIREKWKDFLDFLVKGITEHIYGYYGVNKDEVTACLGMVCVVSCRAGAACIQGALAMMQEADGWCFSGILKRTWGIVALDQDGKQHFEILLPGGEELPLGYEKQIFVMPKGNEECVQIHFCSVPAGWRYGDDASLLFCEKSLKVISDNLKFPCRKIQVGIRVSDRLQLYAYDMTSGRRVCDEADPVWERALDCMIETEEERR